MKKSTYFDIFFIMLFIVKLIFESMVNANTLKYLNIVIYGYAALKMIILINIHYKKSSNGT